jgi:hypothetical protein
MTIRDQVAINPLGSPLRKFMVRMLDDDELSIPIKLRREPFYHALSFRTPAGQETCLVAVSEDSEAEIIDPVHLRSNFRELSI